MTDNALSPNNAPVNVALAPTGFAPTNLNEAWQFATNLAKSDLVPADMYHEKPANCMIALDLASRWGVPWLAVMQHVYVVHGRPALDSTLTTALVNRSNFFTGPIAYQVDGKDSNETEACDESYRVRAYATRRGDTQPIMGPWIDWKLVHGEKWDQPKQRRGGGGTIPSKWTTMSEQMFHYRAATWFQRRYCPELTFGMSTVDEAQDIPVKTVESQEVTAEPGAEGLKERLGMTDDPQEPAEEKPDETTPADPKPPMRVFACTTPDCLKECRLDPKTIPDTPCDCGTGTLIFKTERAKRLKAAKEKEADDKAAAAKQAEADRLKREAGKTAKAKLEDKPEGDVTYKCSSCKGTIVVKSGDTPLNTNKDGEPQCTGCLKFTLKVV